VAAKEQKDGMGEDVEMRLKADEGQNWIWGASRRKRNRKGFETREDLIPERCWSDQISCRKSEKIFTIRTDRVTKRITNCNAYNSVASQSIWLIHIPFDVFLTLNRLISNNKILEARC
jgi:hypothetical protein